MNTKQIRASSSYKLPTWFLSVPILLLALVYVTSMLGIDALNRPEENTLRNIVWMGNRSLPRGHDDIRLYKDEIIEMVDTYSAQHIPGHYLQLATWGDLVGLDLVMLRAVSMFYYLISCAMVYRLTRDILNQSVAVFALFFMAFSGYHVFYAHEIRMYAVLVTEAVIVLWVYWRIVISPKPNHWYHWLSLLIWTIFGLYTHVIIVFPLLAMGAYHFLFAPKNRIWIQVAVTQVLAGIAFLPWLPSAIYGINDAKDLSDTSQSTLEVIGSSLFLYSNGFWVGAVLLIALFFWKYPRKNKQFNAFMMIGALMVAIMLVFNLLFSYIPFRRMRYTLVILPLLAIFWGYGLYIVYHYRRWLVGVIAVVWLGMFVWFGQSDELYVAANLEGRQFDERYPYNISGDYFRNHYLGYPGLDDWVVTFHPLFNYTPGSLNYYEYIYGRQFEALMSEVRDEHSERLDRIKDSYPGFWFSYRSVDEAETLKWLDLPEVAPTFANFEPCLQPEVNPSIQVIYYLDNRLSCELFNQPERQAVTFNNDYILRDYVIETDGNQMNVSLWWQNPTMTFNNEYGYSIQVFRGDEKVGQIDSPVHNVVTFSRVTLDDVPSGTYSVRLILYTSADVSSVGGTTDTGRVFERDFELSQVEISE